MNATESTTFPAYLERIAAHGIIVTEPHHVARLREMWADEEAAKASYPAVTPACPSWCIDAAGHEYPSHEPQGDGRAVHIRDHVVMRTPLLEASQQERNLDGVVTLLPATIYCEEPEGVTAERAREIASDLLLAAALLDSITNA